MDLLFKDEILTYLTVIYDDKCEVPFQKQDQLDFFDYKVTESTKNGMKKLSTLDDESSYIKNKKNLLSSVTFDKRLLVVEQTDEKISFKVFNSRYHRPENSKWFRVSKRMEFITYRFRDGAVFTGELTNYHKKRKSHKRIRRYVFGSDDIINHYLHVCKTFYSYKKDRTRIFYNDLKPIGVFIDNIPGIKKYFHLPMKEKFYRTFLDKNGVKYPDNYMSFMYIGYPGFNKKVLSKNNNKMIDTLMSINGFSGGKIRKILHKINGEFIADNYKQSIDFYGEPFMLSQSDKILTKIFSHERIINLPKKGVSLLSKKELNNSFKLLTCVYDRTINEESLYDHFKFYVFLKRREIVKWLATDVESFIVEHQLWSDKYSDYTSGNFERIYSQEFINYIETPIPKNGEVFYPVALIDSETYNEESKIQCNCVRTYIRNVYSLIVSLRVGDIHSDLRATIEYVISTTEKGTIKLVRGQSRGKYNSNLDDKMWGESLKELDLRVSTAIKLKMFNDHKIKILFKNGTNKEVNHKITHNNSLYIGKTTYKLEWEDPDLIYNVNMGENSDFYYLENLNF